MTDEELLYWYGLLERALDAKANAPLQTAPALGDERQSEGRRAFDSMIYRIADRIKDAPRAPVPPMVVAYGANPGSAAEAHTSEADELSASELLKVLRWKLGMKS
jgi:hypothetical protein